MSYGWKKCKHKIKVKDVISALSSMPFDAALIKQEKSNFYLI